MTQITPGRVTYDDPIETEITRLAGVIAGVPALKEQYRPRWLAIQLLEGDETLLHGVNGTARQRTVAALADARARLAQIYGEDVDIALTDSRYSYVHELTQAVLTAPAGERLSLSDRIDLVVTNRWLGLPILLALMYVVFNLVQNVSAPYLDWVDAVFSGPLTHWATALLQALHAPGWLVSLVTGGVIAGVGGVLTFLPGLLIMYFSLAFLETSGYLARAAFVMDRIMTRLGLHGQSFVPMILGFGCNVPAVYATRTIENRSARILTGLLVPFMSCSARLPVYVVFGLALFPRHANVVIWGMYVLGIVVAALVSIVLSRTLFPDAREGVFVMEMPSYRWPSLGELLRYTWRRSAAFVRKAGTLILLVSIIFWVLLHLPWGVEEPRQSYFGQVSEAIAPVFAPAGFGEWQKSGALVSGVLAKEVVISTMSQVYVGETEPDAAPATLGEDVRTIVVGFGTATLDAGKELLEALTPGLTLFSDGDTPRNTALAETLQAVFTPLSAIAFLVFVLLYVPCMATVSAQTQEFGTRWALLSVAITLLVPWTLAVLVYQGGRLLGLA